MISSRGLNRNRAVRAMVTSRLRLLMPWDGMHRCADGAAEAGILRLREADGKKDDFSFIAEAETYPAKFVRCRKRGLAIYIP
jgi:hypothetical protein